MLDLYATPRQARRTYNYTSYSVRSGDAWLAACARAQGWHTALFLPPWPGDNGVTRGQASTETQRELLEAIVGQVFLHSMVQGRGVDQAMEDAWHLFATVAAVGSGAPPLLGTWRGAMAALRARLSTQRPGRVKVWVDRLGLRWPSEPTLIAAATQREWEGQSLEFLGDGVLRLLHTLHLLRSLPEADCGERSLARIAMERNAFLSRRLVRVIGGRADDLSKRLYDAHAAVLPTMSSHKLAGGGGGGGEEEAHADGFREDLISPQGSHKILADVLEALVGAVALQDEGLGGAGRAFARALLPPPQVLADLANGEVAVPGMANPRHRLALHTAGQPASQPGPKH